MVRWQNMVVAGVVMAVAWWFWHPLVTNRLRGAAVLPATLSASPGRSARGVWQEAMALEAELDRRLPEVNFTGQGLGDAIDFLGDVSGANIYVDWAGLEAAGYTRETSVVFRAKDARFRRALRGALAAAGGGGLPPVDLVVDDGVILITTRARIEAGARARTFDVTELVKAETDPLRLAFGVSPFVEETKMGPRAEALREAVRSSLGVEAVKRHAIVPSPFSAGAATTPGTITSSLIVVEAPAGVEGVERYLERRRWLPGAQALGLRAVALLVVSVWAMRLVTGRGWRRWARRRGNRCEGCGYDLRGTPEGCPECGEGRSGVLAVVRQATHLGAQSRRRKRL